MSMLNSGTAARPAADRHPHDYYYREGMPLRPPPETAAVSPLWLTRPHIEQFSPWIPVRAAPVQTPLTRLFDDHRWQGDELMDAVVLAFTRTGTARGREMFDRALDHGIDAVEGAPPALVDLFHHLDEPPEWFDADRWERGRRLWINASLSGKLTMMLSDAMGTFVGAEVSSATGQTRRFLADFRRRELETVTWFYNVTRPGGADRHSAVFKSIVRVRLMHAQARLALRRIWGDEHFARHGNPISNAMTMGAAVTFGLLPPLFDHARGRRIARADLDSVMLYWACIAHLMGVADELVPRDAADGLRMAHHMILTAGGPTEWTDITVRAACDHVLSRNPVLRRLQVQASAPVVGLVSALTGEPLVRALLRASPLATLRLQPWQGIAQRLVHLNVAVRRAGDRLPNAERRLEARARGGDAWQRRGVAMVSKLAARSGVSGTPYDHHDTSVG
ncbi:oxygenase MpaB family protein [Actinomadura sp. WMMA1423]|uniref:oxygenase MpaB family protein n=1 Tax=Actinomadura sp. WMMA1423 TaxID=2591108 RepID=UPI00197AE8F2|nr:oxygenase MpaB family protein [Actinomadura sp. WMMA1423]